MKQGTTLFLRFIISLAGIGVLALCLFALPHLWKGGSEEFPMASNALFLITIILYTTALPFFIALWKIWKLLSYIDQNQAFSAVCVTSLKDVKHCMIIIAVLYLTMVPLLYPIADADDAPGLIIIGAAIACIPIVAAVTAAVLQTLLQHAVDMKSEQDLTV